MAYIRYKYGEANFEYIEKFDSIENAANPKAKGELVEVKINDVKFDFTKVKKESDEKQQQGSSIRQAEKGIQTDPKA